MRWLLPWSLLCAVALQQTELGAHCLVADLETMNTEVLEQTPANFRIVEIVDDAGLEDFKRVFVAACKRYERASAQV